MRKASFSENRWTAFLGLENVLTEKDAILQAETATFRTNQQIRAILRPSSTEEVSQIIKQANSDNIPLYFSSKGRNWGLGSRVPVSNNCLLVDLSRMNRIVDFNEELSFISLEPGVSFKQVRDFLKEKQSELFLSVIGGPPDASVLANALERGEGLGPMGDRSNYCCNLQIVLPDGSVIETGFADGAKRGASKINRCGVGPSCEGLFFQSNLGVVTRITIWLNQKPKVFQPFCIQFSDDHSLEKAIVQFRNLQQLGVLKPTSLAIWNRYKFLASQMQYPWELSDGKVLDPDRLIEKTNKFWKDTKWFAFGALYSASRAHAIADSKLLKQSVGKLSHRFVLLSPLKARLLSLLAGPISKVSGLNLSEVLDTLYYDSVYLGNPTETSLKSTYWRKKQDIPSNIDPDRDKCGLFWLCNVVPYTAADLFKSSAIVESTAKKFKIEPNLAFLNASERKLHLFTLLVYDREVEGADSIAEKCFFEMAELLSDSGYSHYRVGIKNMPDFVSTSESSLIFKKLKGMLDPNKVVAPGRYDGASIEEKVEVFRKMDTSV